MKKPATSRTAKPSVAPPPGSKTAATKPAPKPARPAGIAPRDSIAFSPIKTRRISEEIGARIRQQIAAGELQPGDRLPTERELAELFAVSRMAVREGMRNLEVAGLISLHKGRHGGAFVSDGSHKLVTQSLRDMLDLGRASLPMLMEARRHIMDIVVRLACERATPASLAALEKNTDETEALTKAGRFEERTYTAIEFNRVLAEATRNQILCAIVEALSEVLRHFVSVAGVRPHDPVVAMRRALTQQIRARDADAAVAIMMNYLDGLETYLQAHGEASGGSQPGA
ncbi:GntR family transcriptional regulator [Humitalea rosea]|uniref:GntR family transcriptional regulator n=1 Tax=Humitalea rosea TaxID=990373 RepID=A0A2W7II53_9PROT|nr:GntR family transcriptional regulator [Humitalea rosea]PZW44825.1 GntR family transcriptional regulator [Humitalea rosea]